MSLSKNEVNENLISELRTLRQCSHRTGSIWNWYEIGTGKPCVYMGSGGISGVDRICYLVPNGSIYEVDPMWNCIVPA